MWDISHVGWIIRYAAAYKALSLVPTRPAPPTQSSHPYKILSRVIIVITSLVIIVITSLVIIVTIITIITLVCVIFRKTTYIRWRVVKEGRKGGHQYIYYLWTQHPQRPTLFIPPAVLSNIAKYILSSPNLKCVSNMQVNTGSRSGVHPHAFNTPPQTCAVGQSIFISKIKAGSIYITSIITIGHVAIRTHWSSITIIDFEGFPFYFNDSTEFFVSLPNLAFLKSHNWWWWQNCS